MCKKRTNVYLISQTWSLLDCVFFCLLYCSTRVLTLTHYLSLQMLSWVTMFLLVYQIVYSRRRRRKRRKEEKEQREKKKKGCKNWCNELASYCFPSPSLLLCLLLYLLLHYYLTSVGKKPRRRKNWYNELALYCLPSLPCMNHVWRRSFVW